MRPLRAIGHAVLIALAALLGVVAALATFIGAAAITTRPALFTLAGLAALALGTTGLVALASRGLAPPRRRAVRRLVPAATIAATVPAAALTIFQPLGDPYHPPTPVPGQQTWDLPTGSRLAYARAPARGAARPTPIVYLHGGPGVSELPEAVAHFGRLAADGYDVYAYDQIGTGRSARLADPTGYTLARHVADLEAARERIGAERVILIGHSWGATLAAAYLAAHPERVAKVVFSSPGALALHDYGTTGTGIVDRLPAERRGRVNALLYQPRATAAWALTQVNPRAAHAFAGDRELDARFDRITSLATPGLFCDTATDPLPVDGTGFYANQVTLMDRDAADPRPALRAARAPALILKGACDYLPWRIAIEYRDTLPGAALVYLPGAGHQAYLEQPGPYFAAVRAFLLDQPPPIAPYTGAEPPADYAGAR